MQNSVISRVIKRNGEEVDFDKSKISEIEELMRVFLTDKEKDKFTCKKDVYDLLVERKFENLNMEEIHNDEILKEMRHKLEIYKYVIR